MPRRIISAISYLSLIHILWGVHLNAAHPEYTKSFPINIIGAKDVAMMMALLKIARICTGTGTEDSFIDLAGYAACGGEIAGGTE